MIKVSIIGGAGLVAGRLLKILLSHKKVRIVHVVSDSSPGTRVTAAHPFLAGETGLLFDAYDRDTIVKDSDVIFIIKGHGDFISETIELANKKVKIIDFGANFRLTSPALYDEWYGFKRDASGLKGEFIYGIPELYYRDIKKARLVANPGCYPTSVILALAPLLNKYQRDIRSITINSTSGISGAGNQPKQSNLAMNVLENCLPYRIFTHQHTPEIEQELSRISGKKETVVFIPNLAPFKYGILSNIYLELKGGPDSAGLTALYRNFYAKSPFVRISDGPAPEVKNVAGTNYCDLGLYRDKRTGRVLIVSAIDNAIKGAAGQAVQNMNLMAGFPEDEGLR